MKPAIQAPRLVLWDIDQTLIEGGTVTHSAYATAFRRATGRRLEHPWRLDGRTELAAATEVLQAHGLSLDPRVIPAAERRDLGCWFGCGELPGRLSGCSMAS
jgi:hypothetical protein